VSKTVGEVETPYLWDRQAAPSTGSGQGLPLLLDDGTDAYLHADNALAELDAAGQPTYLLDDALGSVRGLTDSGGSLTGTADYDVFGQVRASSGAASVFGFTGQQLDAETGLTYLRARYLDPRLGRFLSADSLQPNAPGSQGYNPYAYAANNPTTWVDPSGHMPQAAKAAIAIIAIQAFLTISPPIGLGLIILLAAPPLICALDPGCRADWWEYNNIIGHYGSKTWEGAKDLPPGAARIVRRLPDLGGEAISDALDKLQCLDLRQGCATKKLEDLLVDKCGGTVRPYEGGGGVRIVENVTGICADILNRTGYDAFTVGHTIFGKSTFQGERGQDLLRHELRHVAQYQDHGDLVLITYFGTASAWAAIQCAREMDFSIDCLHDKNFLEQVIIAY
jgi:RHS repeat-associated protein